MRHKILLIGIIILANCNLSGQEKQDWNHEVGINILQIPATTLDFTYNLALKPRYSLSINSGYTFNYSKSCDLFGFFLSPHYKAGNDAYSMKNQSGGFLNLGLKYAFRSSLKKDNYFYFGSFISNSLIYERADYDDLEILGNPIVELSHSVFIFGFTAAVGYNFKLSNKLNSDFGVHISVPSKKYTELYGYCNYIPGFGYMETLGDERLFPMLVLNLKYKLK
jgi:hypothetical protein